MQGNTLLKVPQLLDANMHDRQRHTILATGQVTINEGYTAAVKEEGGRLTPTPHDWLAARNPCSCPPPQGWEPSRTSSQKPRARSSADAPNIGPMQETPAQIRDKRGRYGEYRDRALSELEPSQHTEQGKVNVLQHQSSGQTRGTHFTPECCAPDRNRALWSRRMKPMCRIGRSRSDWNHQYTAPHRAANADQSASKRHKKTVKDNAHEGFIREGLAEGQTRQAKPANITTKIARRP